MIVVGRQVKEPVVFEKLKAWYDQADARLESWVEAFLAWWRGFPARWESFKTSPERAALEETFQQNWVWLKSQTKLLVNLILVGILFIVPWLFALGATGNVNFKVSSFEWIAMAAFAVVSIALHRIAGRGWGRAIVLTIIELAAWLLVRIFFHNQRFYFMLNQGESSIRLDIAWIIGLLAWFSRGKWTSALDMLFWRLRLLAELWQGLYGLFPGAKIVLNGALLLGGVGLFFTALLQNPWLWVVLIPILFVWLASALLPPPTEVEKVQRAEMLAARAAGVELHHESHGGAHSSTHEVRPEDEAIVQTRRPRKPTKPH